MQKGKHTFSKSTSFVISNEGRAMSKAKTSKGKRDVFQIRYKNPYLKSYQTNLMYKTFLALLLLSFFSCNVNKPCTPETPKKIQSIYLSDNNVESYLHEIEISNVSLKCDSTIVMTLINSYIESNMIDNPISGIAVFKSTKHFDSGESLSQPESYYDDQLMSVYFDESSGHPKHFIFYNNGKIIYKGDKWVR